MKAKKTWTFSCPLEEVDVARILREAGPEARAVRFTIDGKWYVAINREWLREQGWVDETSQDPVIDWTRAFPEEPGYVDDRGDTAEYPVSRRGDFRDGEVLVECDANYDCCDGHERRWAITRDLAWAQNFLDLVETTVEVF